MKKYLLAACVLVTIVAFFDMSSRGVFRNWRSNLTPTSCRAVRVKLDRRIPGNWKTTCIDGRYMTPGVDHKELKNHFANDLIINIRNFIPKNTPPEKIEAFQYRELSNYLISVALKSPQDNLEKVGWVIMRLHHKNQTLAARTKGINLAKLANMKNKKFIAQHLQATVKIQIKKEP